jgi:acyl-ACP thioesterase
MSPLTTNPPLNLLQQRIEATMRDCQLDFKVTVPVILNWLQEAASQHAAALGVGLQALQALGVTWVLTRMSLHITRVPKWGEKLILSTWPSGIRKRLIAERQFMITNEQGETLVEASSEWLCVNLTTGKLAPLPKDVQTLASPDTHNFDLCRRTIPQDVASEETPYSECFKARKAEIDANNHVNNVHFANWLLEPLPEKHYFEATPLYFDIEYKLPVKVNDSITAMVWALPENTYIHRLFFNDGKLVAQAQSIYTT